MKRSRIRYAKKKADPVNTLAVPEILPGIRGHANWHISVGNGHFATLNSFGGAGKMMLPTNQDDLDKVTRLHEMLHAAHSPVEAPRDVEYLGAKISSHAIVIAEEVRINSITRHMIGEEILATGWKERDRETFETLSKLYAKTKDRKFLEALIDMTIISPPITTFPDTDLSWKRKDKLQRLKYASSEIYGVVQKATQPIIGRKRATKLAKLLFAIGKQVYLYQWRDAYCELPNRIPSWAWVLKLAAYIDKLYSRIDHMEQFVSSEPDSTGQPADLEMFYRFEEGANNDRDVNDLTKDREMERPAESFNGQSSQGDAPVNLDSKHLGLQWAPMDIIDKPKELKLPGKFRMKSKLRSSDMGTVPRNIHRLMVDGKVFSTKRMEPAVSILIDASGSMSFSRRDIEEIIKELPGSIVATYMGDTNRGELWIVAKDGKYTKDVRHAHMLNNLVDLPALEWLAEQPEPRIWVSDGEVIPLVGDMKKAYWQIGEFCQKHNINRVANTHEARNVLKGERVLLR